MRSTKRMMTWMGLFLAMAVPSFAQRGFTIPRIPTIPRTPSVPRSTPSVQTPRNTPRSTPQPSARQQAQSRKEVQKEQKAQAGEQKAQQKQNKKEQKKQARQQKEQKKQQQKQQKEAARQQKELQKQQKNSQKKAKISAKESKSRSESASAEKGESRTGSKAAKVAPVAGGSQARLQQLNSNRSNLSGINRKPLPAGELAVHPNGRMTLNAEGGRQYGLRSNGSIASYSDRQKTVSFDKEGRVSSIHTASMDIHRGPRGQRTVISRRADGSKVVSTGRHSGYVERRVVMNNRTYIQRTSVINQRVFSRTFMVNGFGRAMFVPPVFFAPGFYGWAYYPWLAPIHFAWGWVGAPWYIGPNPYFLASPVYPSAAFWLTDYMIGETLATAYQLHHGAAADEMADDMDDTPAGGSNDDGTLSDAANGGDSDGSGDLAAGQEHLRADATTPITAELKAEIAEQVKQQLASDNAQSGNPGQASFDTLPAALSTPNHIFVVSNDLDVTTGDEQLCGLEAGDMLQLMSPAASDSSFVQLRVASSKRMDCPAGVLVNVSLTDLQEMQNSFQAQVEAGLAALQRGQGRDGLPAAPAATVAAPPVPAVSGLETVSGPESATLLDQQRDQADQAQAQAESGRF